MNLLAVRRRERERERERKGETRNTYKGRKVETIIDNNNNNIFFVHSQVVLQRILKGRRGREEVMVASVLVI